VNIHPLRVEREQHGWSRSRLAGILGVSVQTVMRWEQGRTTPYPYYREQLCNLFGKNTRELGLLAQEDSSAETNTLSTRVALSLTSAQATPQASPMLRAGATQSLTGRGALLQQVKEQLLAGNKNDFALTALKGLPGVGKTALALALATDQQVQAHFSDGILWVGLGPEPDVPGLLTQWGKLLGVGPAEVENIESCEDWSSILHATIGSRRMLLIIDDAWNGKDALTFQVGGRSCAHLLTTRHPQVAFTFAQEGTITIPELTEADALTLLARFVPQIVSRENKIARALVRAVDGLPLALVQIGKYLANLRPAQPRRLRMALAQLQDARRRLALEPSNSVLTPSLTPTLTPSEHALLSVQRTIAVSDRALSEQAHAALAALALFPAKPNSFSEEAALVVSQASVEILDELWDAGLLESNEPGRYSLHATIADYARNLDEAHLARIRLANYMLDYIREHRQDAEALKLEIANLLAALDGAAELGMARPLIEGTIILTPLMHTHDLWYQATSYQQRALEAAIQLDDQAAQIALLQLGVSF
jgi:transcriptional regulator with XRE-family HTH domain